MHCVHMWIIVVFIVLYKHMVQTNRTSSQYMINDIIE